MRVLIATTELQGVEPGDYSGCVDGELVTGVVTECCEGDRCGCSRGWVGLGSSAATTTAMVVERPGIASDDLRDAVDEWLRRSGWSDLIREATEAGEYQVDGVWPDDPDQVIAELIDEHLESIAKVCDSFPVGTVVVRRGGLVFARALRDAA